MYQTYHTTQTAVSKHLQKTCFFCFCFFTTFYTLKHLATSFLEIWLRKMVHEYRKQHVIELQASSSECRWCGGFGISTAVQQPLKTPTSTHPPMLPPSLFPEVPAEAMMVRPLVGNFLWSAGNNLTWGLNRTDNRKSEQTAPLRLSCPPQGTFFSILFGALFHIMTLCSSFSFSNAVKLESLTS